MKNLTNYFAILLVMLIVGCAATKIKVLNGKQVRLINRNLLSSEVPNAIELNAKVGEGLAVLEEVKFETGTLEFDLQGEDSPGQSFVGMAFNIQNDSTFECIYFRPFNFHADEKIRREHSIQYVYHPNSPWSILRKDSEGVYEAEFVNPPLATDWFRTQIVVGDQEVSVFDSKTGDLLLNVERLSETKSDKIAFWVGHNSSGGFKNLQIKKSKVVRF